MTIFDVHAHIVPRPLLDELQTGPRYGVELLTANAAPSRLRIAGKVTTGPLRPGLLDVAQRLQRMDEQGVNVQLLSPFIDTSAYQLPTADGQAYSRWFNDALAEVVGNHPTRFLGLGNVPLQDPQAACTELTYLLDELGMVGCQIATTVAGKELDEAGLEPFWELAAARGAFIVLHPYAALAGRDLAAHFLHNLVGNPAESTIAVARLILSGVLERHPALRLCVVHGGGFLPYQLGRLDRGYRAVPQLVATALTRAPSEWARSLYYDTVTHAPESLELLLRRVGPGQVVLGSDHPFEMGDPDPVGTVMAIPGLATVDREAILGDTVGELLGATAPGLLPPAEP